jgi:hypothetical protein
MPINWEIEKPDGLGQQAQFVTRGKDLFKLMSVPCFTHFSVGDN